MEPGFKKNTERDGLWLRLNRGRGTVPLLLKLLPLLLIAGHLLTAAYWQALHVNRDYHFWDQAAVMRLAADIQSTGNPFLMDGTRHPLFAWLLAPWVRWDTAFFVWGRLLAFAVSLLFLLTWGLLFRKRTGILLSAWLPLFLSLPFGVSLLFGQVIPDVLFTLWNTAALYCLFKSFRYPRYAFVGGLLTGLAFLTKYSGFMLLYAYEAFLALWIVYDTKKGLDEWRPKALAGVLALAGALIVAAPLLVNNARLWGSPFYNIAARYTVWSDSWEQAENFFQRSREGAWPREYSSRLEEMPQDSVPSVRSYFKRHTFGFALYRWKAGLHLNGLVWWKGRGAAFFGMLLFSAVLLLTVYREKQRDLLDILIGPQTAFLGIYSAVYFVTMTWYEAIAVNLRYVYPLHAALGFGLFYLMREAEKGARLKGWQAGLCGALLAAVFILVAAGEPHAMPDSSFFKTLEASTLPVTPYP